MRLGASGLEPWHRQVQRCPIALYRRRISDRSSVVSCVPLPLIVRLGSSRDLCSRSSVALCGPSLSWSGPASTLGTPSRPLHAESCIEDRVFPSPFLGRLLLFPSSCCDFSLRPVLLFAMLTLV